MQRSMLSASLQILNKTHPCRNVTTKCGRVLRQTRMQMMGRNIFFTHQKKNVLAIPKQCLSVDSSDSAGPLSQNMYEAISNETLESLLDFCETFEDLKKCPKEFDVTFASGVLTLSFGHHGTYVINKQSPNRQIWLSSPFSGPKRYDFEDGKWIYKHDGVCLHVLLQNEFSKIFEEEISMEQCAYS